MKLLQPLPGQPLGTNAGTRGWDGASRRPLRALQFFPRTAPLMPMPTLLSAFLVLSFCFHRSRAVSFSYILKGKGHPYSHLPWDASRACRWAPSNPVFWSWFLMWRRWHSWLIGSATVEETSVGLEVPNDFESKRNQPLSFPIRLFKLTHRMFRKQRYFRDKCRLFFRHLINRQRMRCSQSY
jgi:hypothetical protein